MNFNEEYYRSNKQDKDRIGLFFYKNLINYYFKPKAILDYGFGTGYLLKRLSRLRTVQSSYGFEINEFAINEAKNNSKNTNVISDLKKINSESIDTIISLHVIEHLSNKELEQIIKSFRRILNKNGNIVFATPAKDGLAHKIKQKTWIGFSDKTHINLKTFKEWKNFFNSNGLKIIKSSNDGLWDFPYNHNKFTMGRILIFIKMIFQILTGRLLLKYDQGETFIFILQFE